MKKIFVFASLLALSIGLSAQEIKMTIVGVISENQRFEILKILCYNIIINKKK